MKRLGLTLLLCVAAACPLRAQSWPTLMRDFEPAATGYSPANAYALAYLTTLVYAQNIALQRDGTDNTAFRDSLETRSLVLLANFIEVADALIGDGDPDYTFVHACTPNGYDPEAMVINTSKAILVVFRGTDRVGCATRDGSRMGEILHETQWQIGEWLGTDFDIAQVDMMLGGVRIAPGKVHRGFWNSLATNELSFIISKGMLRPLLPAAVTQRAGAATRELAASRQTLGSHANMAALTNAPRANARNQSFLLSLEEAVRRYAAAAPGKPIWVAGHSLGGAHAQLSALYLKSRQLNVAGVYGFAGPNVGSRELTDALDVNFPGHRLTRFVFAQDPIPSLAIGALGFGSAGRVVWYEDFVTRTIVDDDNAVQGSGGSLLRVGANVGGLVTSGAGNALAGAAGVSQKVQVATGLETVCFHHPQWYLHAAWFDLERSGRHVRMPAPLQPVPNAQAIRGYRPFSPCSRELVERARQKSIGNVVAEGAQDIVDAAADAFLNFSYDATFLLGNEIGNADFEGTYQMELYASTLAGRRKVLDRDRGGVVNLSGLGSNTEDNEFVIRRSGIGGYTIAWRNGAEPAVLTPKGAGADLLARNKDYEFAPAAVVLPACPLLNPLCGVTQRHPTVEQTWRFYKLKEADNLFLIENRLSGKVLDANDGCSVSNVKDCRVKSWERRQNDATQLWVLRRVRR